MTDLDELSQRVWDQLRRNRIMDQMVDLARGNARVYRMGSWDYFECFFDWFPSEGPWEPNPSMSVDEVEACRKVVATMQAASAATPKRVGLDELVETGWPERIRPWPSARPASSSPAAGSTRTGRRPSPRDEPLVAGRRDRNDRGPRVSRRGFERDRRAKMSVTLIAMLAFIGAVCVRTWRKVGLVALIAWALWAAWMGFLVTLMVTRSPAGNTAQLAGYVTAELLTGAGAVVIATIVGHALRRLGSALAGGPKEPRGASDQSRGEPSIMVEQTAGADERSSTPLIVGVVVLSILVALLATRRAAVMASLGNWGGAVGVLVGPFVWYAGIELLLTWAARRVFGQSGSRFATSRLNYLALALTVVPVLGSLTRPIA